MWILFLALATPIVEICGTDVTGRITELRSTRGRNDRMTHAVHYAYPVGVEERTGNISVSPDVYERLQVGQDFAVRVLPPLPRSFDQPRGPGSPGSKVLAHFLVALFWNGILALFLWKAWVRPWRQRTLVRDGLATKGTITNKFLRGGGKGLPAHVIQYDYSAPAANDPDGMRQASYHGETATSKELFDAANVGEAVVVLFHPRNPRRSIAYEFAEYEAVAD